MFIFPIEFRLLKSDDLGDVFAFREGTHPLKEANDEQMPDSLCYLDRDLADNVNGRAGNVKRAREKKHGAIARRINRCGSVSGAALCRRGVGIGNSLRREALQR